MSKAMDSHILKRVLWLKNPLVRLSSINARPSHSTAAQERKHCFALRLQSLKVRVLFHGCLDKSLAIIYLNLVFAMVFQILCKCVNPSHLHLGIFDMYQHRCLSELYCTATVVLALFLHHCILGVCVHCRLDSGNAISLAK